MHYVQVGGVDVGGLMLVVLRWFLEGAEYWVVEGSLGESWLTACLVKM